MAQRGSRSGKGGVRERVGVLEKNFIYIIQKSLKVKYSCVGIYDRTDQALHLPEQEGLSEYTLELNC